MATTMKRVKVENPKVEKTDPTFDEFQICAEFSLSGTSRAHILKKYKGQSHTITDWSDLVRREGL